VIGPPGGRQAASGRANGDCIRRRGRRRPWSAVWDLGGRPPRKAPWKKSRRSTQGPSDRTDCRCHQRTKPSAPPRRRRKKPSSSSANSITLFPRPPPSAPAKIRPFHSPILRPEDWQRVLAVKCHGMGSTSPTPSSPHMVERKSGGHDGFRRFGRRSRSDRRPNPHPTSASIQSRQQSIFAQCMAKDLAPHGIGVNTVCPRNGARRL